ncbi:ABC transporter ATP-binding protein [Holdemania massiliensis]|uniref:ABC transporter ATP-binding protein n=1 Tax=Holdemania massiliensis TaxID=1468449 RepID=UPI003562FCEC
MDECIRIANLTKTFQGKTALNQLNCVVKQGEIYGFLGPSGAGKTTTIKLLTGQLKPQSGELTVLGKPVVPGRNDLYSQIGVLTDNSGFYEKMTVRENLKLFARISQTTDTRIQQVLEQLGLAEHQNKKAEKLSRGMKQRLMFARAILHQPKLLFLDEPTANLDPSTSEDVHALIRQMNSQGTTIFLTTHNMEEAQELCDHVAFLNEGHIVEEGTPSDLRLKYAEDAVELRYKDGTCVRVRKDAEALREALKQEGQLLTIHSQEPDLKTIFLQLTGRDLR